MPRGEKYTPITAVRRLLLATDGSAHSDGAVREALRLAKRRSSTLHVISVVGKKREADVEKILKSIKDAASKDGIECDTTVARGDPSGEIIKVAEEKRVDLIIMGRRGLGWLRKTIKGSVISRVMEYANCNVLIVPKESRIECKTILVATDGSALGRAAAIAGISFARQCAGRLIALSAIQGEDERAAAEAVVNGVAEQAGLDGVAVEPVTPVGKPYDAIVDTAGETDAGLIVIGAFGKSPPKRFLTGSVVEKVVENAGCAVLVVKPER